MYKIQALNKNKQQQLLLSICITVVGLSLGYAALQQSLQINAEATVGSLDTNWKVEFTEDETGKTGVATGTAVAGTMTLNNTDVTISDVKLLAPGDTVTYTFDVENSGTIPAKLSTYTPKVPTFTGTGESGAKTADETLVEENYEYKIKWTDSGSEITSDNTQLGSHAKKNITVTITYKNDAQNLPVNEVKISNLGATLLFVQDTDAS